jgi:hypothetical protein
VLGAVMQVKALAKALHGKDCFGHRILTRRWRQVVAYRRPADPQESGRSARIR